MAQLSLLPWQELYNSTTNDIIPSTSDASLNGRLYVELLFSLEEQTL
jgi:hypothetical protein